MSGDPTTTTSSTRTLETTSVHHNAAKAGTAPSATQKAISPATPVTTTQTTTGASATASRPATSAPPASPARSTAAPTTSGSIDASAATATASAMLASRRATIGAPEASATAHSTGISSSRKSSASSASRTGATTTTTISSPRKHSVSPASPASIATAAPGSALASVAAGHTTALSQASAGVGSVSLTASSVLPVSQSPSISAGAANPLMTLLAATAATPGSSANGSASVAATAAAAPPGAFGTSSSPATPAALPTTTASLWQALDLPPPETVTSQHHSKRVVLLGRPLSGKRTLCRRLCLAAEAQYPSSRSLDDEPGSGGRGSGGAKDAGAVRRALYKPAPGEGDDDIVEDIVELNDDWAAQQGASPSFGRRGTGNHFKELPHGAGIVHDYVVQRIPVGGSADSIYRGGITKRTIGFFCCDTAGALAAALPTLQSLEEAVVLIVVDVSQPGGIREQLDRQYEILLAHITSILQTFLPAQDEVKRMKMMEAQQRFWLEEEKRMLPLRATLADKPGEAFVGAPNIKIADVNRNILKVPLRSVCPMKSAIVCTKTDILDRLSKLYETSVAVTADDELPEEVDEIVPSTLRSDLKQHRKPLLPFVAQLVRQYAVIAQSALIAVSSRVSTTATDSAGEAALVHPFYRGIWAYISGRLDGDSVKVAQATALECSAQEGPVEAAHLCSANLFPSAYLPCGLDTLALLLPAIASQSVTLPHPATRQLAVCADVDSTTSPRGVSESKTGVEASFKLHRHYLQQMAYYMSSDRSLSPTAFRNSTAHSTATVEDSTLTL